MTGIGGTSASSTDAHKIFLTQSRLAMGRKGVSLQEKRVRILRIYHKFKDEFNLKKLEKLGSKAGAVPRPRNPDIKLLFF
ncbi:hypothetical protein PF008_g4927 [Phytophthora fragariae]|uniref:Mnd1 HTH domain-containing protein n=1 Tax=Phytophthora fragariae TaxID=53985 RepID=A0A6G0SAY6_9STRA|nr:hypothetical protein PF008_g4927 [Phytophthora fragariae]